MSEVMGISANSRPNTSCTMSISRRSKFSVDSLEVMTSNVRIRAADIAILGRGD
jgi:hypothetical protein